MKKLLTALILLAGGTLWAQVPRLALADFASSTFEKGKLSLLTDAFRTELFKTDLFAIQDQPWVPGTKPAGIDKIASGSVESFGGTWVVSVKVTDTATGTLDFSETATVSDEGLLFRAIKELSAQLSTRYRYGLLASKATTPEETARLTESQWKSLGAEGTTLAGLTALGEGTENYLSFRQFDGTISPLEYLDLRRQNVDLETLRTFLQSGIPYKDARRALAMGITRLDKYQMSFKPAGMEFQQYLDAYEQGLSTPEEYKKYLSSSERDFVAFGLGGVANALPVGTSDFRFFSGLVAWEHSWTKNPRDWYKINTEAGILLLNIVLPVPFAGAYLMVGNAPFYMKAGLGGLAEMLVGNHTGVYFRLGLEVASQFEVTLINVPFGTQPVVNYADFQTWNGSADGPIKFPYFGIMFTYKLPLGTGG